MTRTEKIAANRLDKQIARAFHSCNAMIGVMDIGKVFAAGRAAAAAGQDVDAAVIAIVATLRQNPIEPVDTEHDPDSCGCEYVGSDMWTCGHCDNDN